MAYLSSCFFTLAGKHRSTVLNQNLGRVLAFVAGFINAGGFFLIGQYTSHMTGLLSQAADNIALGRYALGILLLGFIGCFIFGATVTTLLVLRARKRHLHTQYAQPLMLEAALILCISFLPESGVWDGLTLQAIVIAFLCFIMGLQNALITKASTAIIRTTHITGMATDLGIEIGKVLYARNAANNQKKAWLHISIILIFFIGGVTGAICVTHMGIKGLLPLPVLLLCITIGPLLRDMRFYRKFRQNCLRKRYA